ncbi:MAG TPA: hypothetical protein VN541_11825 [Tepidisphaeraceae bacterium]|nr:hypothetical protein [Tepidisphaeraceae bacterium]
MIALKAHFDGRVLVPDEPLALAPNQKVRITVEPIAASPAAQIELGKQPGAITDFAPDWEDPLPEEIWRFEDDR